jgi:catechol 2,3-dioxygenase-like lactoylglutathione lyase family enzyme
MARRSPTAAPRVWAGADVGRPREETHGAPGELHHARRRGSRASDALLRGGLPRLEIPPSVTFFELGKTWLALWARESLAADAGVSAEGTGFRGFSLAHNVRSPAEVDALLSRAAEGGATVLKPGHPTDWGGYAGYFADPDGFLWEVAHNPGFPHV